MKSLCRLGNTVLLFYFKLHNQSDLKKKKSYAMNTKDIPIIMVTLMCG